MPTLYDVLGVRSTASTDEITIAYRERVKEVHPDVADVDRAQKRFTQLTTAREVLTDQEKRTQYDRVGHETYIREFLDTEWPGIPPLSTVSRYRISDDSSAESRNVSPGTPPPDIDQEDPTDETSRSDSQSVPWFGHNHDGHFHSSDPESSSSVENPSTDPVGPFNTTWDEVGAQPSETVRSVTPSQPSQEGGPQTSIPSGSPDMRGLQLLFAVLFIGSSFWLGQLTGWFTNVAFTSFTIQIAALVPLCSGIAFLLASLTNSQ